MLRSFILDEGRIENWVLQNIKSEYLDFPWVRGCPVVFVIRPFSPPPMGPIDSSLAIQ